MIIGRIILSIILIGVFLTFLGLMAAMVALAKWELEENEKHYKKDK